VVPDSELGRTGGDPAAVGRLRDLTALLTRPTSAPAVVLGAVAHAEIASIGAFGPASGLVGRVAEHLDADDFMLTYGDGIGDVDITALLRTHREHGRIGTVTGVHPASRYGEMRVDDEGSAVVAEFNEKPTLATGWVSGGFFAFRREFVDKYLDDDPDLFLEHSPLQQLARDGELGLHRHEGFWMGMDTFRDWTELNGLWDRGAARWKVWED